MFRVTLPALGNQFVSLFKDTSIAFVIAVPELTYAAKWLSTNKFRIIEAYSIAGADVSRHLLRHLRHAPRCSNGASRYGARPWNSRSIHCRSCGRALWSRSAISARRSPPVAGLRRPAGHAVLLRAAARSLGDPLLYCDVIRGIPVLVLIFTVYYGLPLCSASSSTASVTAVVALTVFTTAQVTEIARGAIQSIHFGQTEAGKAIGLGFWPRMIYVVLPAGGAPLPAAMDQQRHRCGQGQRPCLPGRNRRPDAGDPAGDRPSLRADAALYRRLPSSISLINYSLSSVSRQARGAFRLYPGVSGVSSDSQWPQWRCRCPHPRPRQVLRQQPRAERRRSRRQRAARS